MSVKVFDHSTIPMIVLSGAGFETSWVLVGSHAGGANNSTWRTDLGILNRSNVDAEVNVRIHTPDGELSFPVNVGRSDQVILTDVVGQIPYTGSGAIEVVSDQPVVVTSRTYNKVAATQPCYAKGTLGQGLSSYGAGSGLSAGQSAWLTQLTENAAYRTNIALTNIGATVATVTVHLFDDSGAKIGSYQATVAPGEWKQENRPFSKWAGHSDLDAGYAQVTVESGGGVLATGSVVDNITNDPTTILPVL